MAADAANGAAVNLHDIISDVKETFLQETASLREALKKNEQCVCVCCIRQV